MALGRGNSIAVRDIETDKATSVDGIFAAGDAIYGTKSVIMAIESGREAAAQIDQYLGGNGDISEKLAPEQKPDAYIGICEGFGYMQRKTDVLILRRAVVIILNCLIMVYAIRIYAQKPEDACNVI